MVDDDVLHLLRAYPRIYHACHIGHARARPGSDALSNRESWILGHLDRDVPLTATALAAHLGVGASTMSAALAKLERLALIVRTPVDGNARERAIRLTDAGAEAMAAASILDADRVAALLARLTPADRVSALAGITLLADAARSLNTEHPNRWHEADA
ncbi:MAG: MarR family winged helix-turn-helix transcriptional regulator [Gemmatimonadaceae bacterium]|jgi:DNA-binding MarR family transcriptional regulator|nr:MarR family winged helix-turn-helix transcriptional regulator [Gemmatimonadaceae bacterium]